MAAPTLVLDTFTDTPGTNETAHTMDKGTGWLNLFGGAHWTIGSFQLTPPTSPAGFHTMVATDVGKSDFTVSVGITFPNTAYYFCPTIVRVVDKDNLWAVNIERDAGGTPYIQILERVAGANTVRVGPVNIAATNVTISMHVECSGNRITAWTSTGEYLTYSSSLYNTATKVGFWSGSDASYSPLITITGFSVVGETSLIDGLVAGWPFDGDYRDVAGRGNVLTPHSSTFGTGKLGQALYTASASSQYADIASNNLLTFDSNRVFFLRALVYANSLPASGHFNGIICKDDSGSTYGEYALYISGSAGANVAPAFLISSDGTTLGYVYWGSSISTGQWYDIMAWYNGYVMLLDINNSGSPVSVPYSLGSYASGSALSVGRIVYGFGHTAEYHDGRIDEAFIWRNRCLTALERTALYNGGNSLPFEQFGLHVAPPSISRIPMMRAATR